MKTIVYKSLGAVTTNADLQYRIRESEEFLCIEHEYELFAAMQCKVIDGTIVPGSGVREVDISFDGMMFELYVVINPIGMFFMDLDVFDRFQADRDDFRAHLQSQQLSRN